LGKKAILSSFLGVLMKKFAALPLLLLLLFVGCQKENSLISPDTSSVSMEKPAWQVAAERQGLKFIALPDGVLPSLEKRSSDSEYFRVDEFGKLSVEKSYRFSSRKKVSVEASLSVYPGSLSQNTVLSMSCTDLFLNFEFGPEGTNFAKPALLNVEVEGLDDALMNLLSTAHLKYYDAANDEWVDVEAESITVKDGKFVCKNGKIEHFSRYGFTN